MSKANQRRKLREYLDAVWVGDLPAVQRLLEAGVPVDSRHPEHNETALMLAAQKNNLTLTVLLLDKGADVAARDNYQRTALMFARVGSTVFNALLARGADLQARDEYGQTILKRLIETAPPLESITELINLGIDPNARDDSGETALDVARMYGLVAAIELLERLKPPNTVQ